MLTKKVICGCLFRRCRCTGALLEAAKEVAERLGKRSVHEGLLVAGRLGNGSVLLQQTGHAGVLDGGGELGVWRLTRLVGYARVLEDSALAINDELAAELPMCAWTHWQRPFFLIKLLLALQRQRLFCVHGRGFRGAGTFVSVVVVLTPQLLVHVVHEFLDRLCLLAAIETLAQEWLGFERWRLGHWSGLVIGSQFRYAFHHGLQILGALGNTALGQGHGEDALERAKDHLAAVVQQLVLDVVYVELLHPPIEVLLDYDVRLSLGFLQAARLGLLLLVPNGLDLGAVGISDIGLRIVAVVA